MGRETSGDGPIFLGSWRSGVALRSCDPAYGPAPRYAGLAIEAILREDLDGRILPFDRAAARECADIAAARRSAGRPIAPTDCQIAAIARSRDMAVVTRNVRDFDETGIEVVDPWVAA